MTGVPPSGSIFQMEQSGQALLASPNSRLSRFDCAIPRLGPQGDWPFELKTMASMCLDCPLPVLLLWGADHIMLYNEAYANILGDKHPAALGSSVFEIWTETENPCAAMISSIFNEGKTYSYDDIAITLNRDGKKTEGHMALVANPIRMNSGEIGGVIFIAQDTTVKVQTNKQLLIAQAEAHSQKEKLHSLLMQAPVAINILEGKDLIYTLSNNMHARLIGKSDLIGKSCRTVFPELESQGLLKKIEHVYETGEPFVGTEVPAFVHSVRDGETGYFNMIYNPYRGPNGQIEGVMGVGVDVTDQVVARKKGQEFEERSRSLSEALPQMIWTAEVNGSVNYANERCLAYSGLSTREKFGKGWVQTIHVEDLSRVSQAWFHSMKTGLPFEQEYRIRRYDGQYHWFLGRAIAIRDPDQKILYWIGTATDIEEQKRNAQELEVAKQAAEKANATKSAFLANMSHEIRTPLGAILGFSELLKETDLPSLVRNQYVDTIVRSGMALTRIIDDILDLAKVEADRMEVEHIPFSLALLIDEIKLLFSDNARHKGITFEVEVDQNFPTMITSDPTRVRQILVNICGNAVKFTTQGGVKVKVGAHKKDETTLWLVIDVCDTGPGITQEQRHRLFQPFTQADNTTTRQFGGTGLGLALSKRLAEALDGNISIHDNPQGKGTLFRIMLSTPMSECAGNRDHSNAKSQKEHSENEKPPLAGLKILLADDSVDNQIFLHHVLQKRGASVECVGDGSEALQKAKQSCFDLILMDIQMPKMDGYQATRLLLAQGYKKPIVALTAHAMLEERNRTREAGFSGHLTKPINTEELVRTIRDLAISAPTSRGGQFRTQSDR